MSFVVVVGDPNDAELLLKSMQQVVRINLCLIDFNRVLAWLGFMPHNTVMQKSH